MQVALSLPPGAEQPLLVLYNSTLVTPILRQSGIRFGLTTVSRSQAHICSHAVLDATAYESPENCMYGVSETHFDEAQLGVRIDVGMHTVLTYNGNNATVDIPVAMPAQPFTAHSSIDVDTL